MAPGQPGEKPRPRLHHLPQQSALRPPRRPPSSSVSGPGLRPGPALPLPGCRTRERESAGRPPSSCVPRTPQCMRHPDPPRSSRLPWEEGPAGGARPTRRLQKLRLREGQRRAPGQKGGVRAAGVGPAPRPHFREGRAGGRDPGKPRRPRRGPRERRSDGRLGPRIGSPPYPAQAPGLLGRASACDHVTACVSAPPRGGAGSGCRVRGFESTPRQASPMPAGPFAQLHLPAVRVGAPAVPRPLSSSRRGTRGGLRSWECCPPPSGAPAASATGLDPRRAVAQAITHRGTRDMSIVAPFHTGGKQGPERRNNSQRARVRIRAPVSWLPRGPFQPSGFAEPQFPSESSVDCFPWPGEKSARKRARLPPQCQRWNCFINVLNTFGRRGAH